jgi:hypothetical protein
MSLTLEDMIRDSAISIVHGAEDYHKPSLNSEQEKLNAIVRTLLHVEVKKIREESK